MTKAKQAIRILVADDHAIFRDGLRKLLEVADDVQIVGEASNGVECVKMLAKFKPDILLLDLRMPEKDGLGVLEEVNFDSLPTRVIVLTAAEDDRDVVRHPLVQKIVKAYERHQETISGRQLALKLTDPAVEAAALAEPAGHPLPVVAAENREIPLV